MEIDAFELHHLKNWVQITIVWHQQEEVLNRILSFLKVLDEEEGKRWLEKGWRAVYNATYEQ